MSGAKPGMSPSPFLLIPVLHCRGGNQKPDACLWHRCSSGVFDQGNLLLGYLPTGAKLLLGQNGMEKLTWEYCSILLQLPSLSPSLLISTLPQTLPQRAASSEVQVGRYVVLSACLWYFLACVDCRKICLSLLGVCYYLCQGLLIQIWGPGAGAEGQKLRFLCPWSASDIKHPMEWYAGSDLCVNQQQTLTPLPCASSTSPVFSAETLGILIPAGHISSESPCGRKIVKQKEETDTFSAVLFLLQEAQRQPFRQQKLQVTEWALPTRREATAPPCTWGHGGMQAPFPLLDFYCLSRRRCGSKVRARRARHPGAPGAAQTTLCSAPCAAIPQHGSVAEVGRATQ